MIPVLVTMLDSVAAPKGDFKASTPAPDSTPSANTFSALLTGKLSAKSAAAPAAAAAAGDVKAALEAKIAKLLKAGVSETDISSLLTAQLADSVAQALGLATPDARAQLAAVFAGALAPPGDNAPAHGPQTDRGRALAQRFLRLAAIAKTIIDGNSGQQNRIAGHFLDAGTAKETPASKVPASILPALERKVHSTPELAHGAQNVDDGSASRVSPVAHDASTSEAITSASPVSRPSVGATGDGRSVKFDVLTAAGGGGDTLLGRVLTRAALAADARFVPVATQPAASAASTLAANNPGQAQDSSLGHAGTGSAGDALPQSAVAQFIKSFEAALGTAHGLQTSQHDSAQLVADLPLRLDAHESPVVPPAFGPAVAPFSIERTPAPVAPLPVIPTAPADQSAIVDQVLRGAFMRNTAESSEMRLSLLPENLGDVSVKLVVTAGNVSAHVVADTAEVRDALVAAQPQLTKSLADAGLKLQSFTVDLSGNGFAGFSQQHGQSQNGNGNRQLGSSVDEALDDLTLDATPSFAPSMLSTPRNGDYNYLA